PPVVCLALVWWLVMSGSALSAERPKLRATLKGHTDCVSSVTFSSDGQALASAGNDKTIKIWDVGTGIATASTGRTNVQTVAFLPDTKTVVSCGYPGTVKWWSLARRTIKLVDVNYLINIATFQPKSEFVGLSALSPDGKTIAHAENGINVWH